MDINMRLVTSTQKNKTVVKKASYVRKNIVIWLIIIIMAILIVGAFYSNKKTRARVSKIVCATNLKVISNAISLYMADYNGKWPTPASWCDLLLEGGNTFSDTFCCSTSTEGPSNYAINKNILGLQMGEKMKKVVFLFESKPGWNQVGGLELLCTDNHKDYFGAGCNILFGDQHVEWVSAEKIKDLKWIPDTKGRKP